MCGKSRLGLLAGLALALALALPLTASATGTLDQQQTNLPSTGGFLLGKAVAQTFTAGLTGALDRVDLALYRSGTPGDLIVEIRTTAGGVPAVVLASTIVPESAFPAGPSGFNTFVTFTAPAQVVAGTQYAIVLSDPGCLPVNPSHGCTSGYAFQADALNNLYPGGRLLVSLSTAGPWVDEGGGAFIGAWDAGFKTYVSAPCIAGRYSASGSAPCSDADPGFFVSGMGATSQAPCPLGRYQPSSAQTSCLPASIGFYVNATGSATQTACPAGFTTAGIGSTSAAACLRPPFQLTITVHNATGSHAVVLDVEGTDTVEQVKQKLQDKDGLAPSCQRMELAGTGLLNNASTLDSYAIGASSSVHVYDTCHVTSTSLCALTTQFVRSSSNYINAKPLPKKAIDLLVGAACTYLTEIGPRIKPAQKTTYINAYKQAAQGLVQPGWLTQGQADTLKNLAGAL